jgi:uncharacterized protein involved in outer membrane biogenesis
MKSNLSSTRVVKVLLALTSLVILVQACLLLLNITVTSDKARRVLVEQLNVLTQREIIIDDKVEITVSLLPEIVVKGIHIKNVDGFGDDDFIYISKARVQISLIPLLTGDFVLDEIEADHAQIRLILDKEGNHNWTFDHLIHSAEATSRVDLKEPEKFNQGKRFSLGQLRLDDINIIFTDEADNRVIEQHIANLLVDIEDKSRPQAEISGTFQEHPYHFSFESDSLHDLASEQLWNLRGTGAIADSKAEMEANILLAKRDIEGSLDLNIKDINLGLLLEMSGIITGEDAASRTMNIHAEFKGDDLADALRTMELELLLHSGYLKWHAILKDEIRELTFNKIALQASWDKPVKLYLDGKIFDETVKLDFTTNHLHELVDGTDKLDVGVTAHVAGSDISLNGKVDLPVNRNMYQLTISFKGKDLEKLNRILNAELPPFNNYRLTGNISSNERGYIVRLDDATIGDTHFKATVVIDASSFKPFWSINLSSKQLQIKDFEFAESKIDQPNPATIKDSLTNTKASESSKYEPGRRLKDVVDNPRIHFDLNLDVENVLAGATELGSSTVKIKLRDDTLIVEDAVINVPDGKIISSASFMAENGKVSGAFQLDIDKFEYGAVVRYFRPDSPQGGVISADIDLQLAGDDFLRLFDEAEGKLDVALWPRNTRTKVFDLWATNLFMIILPEIRKKESRMNCMVALMDIEDGIMKEDFFGIDTTRVWMTGNINVDFKQESVKLSLYPRSKAARLFAVEAPIRAEGGFNDIHLVTNPVDITVAYVSFITSPLHVPARRIFDDKVPEDASEACERFFDRDYVKALKDKIEAEEQKEIDEWLESD